MRIKTVGQNWVTVQDSLKTKDKTGHKGRLYLWCLSTTRLEPILRKIAERTTPAPPEKQFFDYF